MHQREASARGLTWIGVLPTSPGGERRDGGGGGGVAVLWNRNCCGSSSYFGKVSVPVPTLEALCCGSESRLYLTVSQQ
jgi:hypothetical protein